MDTSIKIGRAHMILTLAVAVLAAAVPLAGLGSPTVTDAPKAPTGKQWQVKYMGGPDSLKRGTHVNLEVLDRAIIYRAVGSRSSQPFSIPAVDVTDVSDALIEGNRAEKVFGPGEPDYVTPCGRFPDPYAAGGCSVAGLALETPFGVVASVLQSIPFHDHFIRIAWQQEGEDPVVVFQVRAKDVTDLREELERVTDKARADAVQRQAPQATIYDAPLTGLEEFDRTIIKARAEEWISSQCQSPSNETQSWLRPPSTLNSFSLCPSNTTGQAEARARLLAK